MLKRLKLDWRLTVQEEIFLFASLMLGTCYFLSWRIVNNTEQSPWDMLLVSEQPLVSYILTLLLVLICLTPWSVRIPRLRPWIGIVTALTVTAALTLTEFQFGQPTYGASLAKLFALTLLVLSANPAVVKATDLTMQRLNKRSAEVFTHWGTVLSGIHFSAQEFYAKVEKEIQAREWPGVEVLRLHYTEAGLFSHKREYLRIVRQRQVVDICASTFGKDYFFTMREAEIQAQLTLVTLLIFLAALLILFTWCVSIFGIFSAGSTFGAVLVAGGFLLRNVLRMGLTRLDGLLMRTPVLGPIYETWFRRSTTYFQHDTRVVFLKMMDDVLKAHVDEETSAKGIKHLDCFEYQPLLDGLYKSSKRNTKPDETDGAH